MKLLRLTQAAVVVGIVLLLVSAAWPKLVGETVWTEQQARELSAAASAMHQLAHAHGDEEQPNPEDPNPEAPNPEDPNPEDPDIENPNAHESDKARTVNDVEKRYERARAELLRAQWTRDGVGRLLRWTGTAACLLGIAGFFALRAGS